MIDEYKSIFEEMKKDVKNGKNLYDIAEQRLSEFENSIHLSRLVRNLCYYIKNH